MHKSINFISFLCSWQYFNFHRRQKKLWGKKCVRIMGEVKVNLTFTLFIGGKKTIIIWVDDLDYPDWGNNRLDIL